MNHLQHMYFALPLSIVCFICYIEVDICKSKCDEICYSCFVNIKLPDTCLNTFLSYVSDYNPHLLLMLPNVHSYFVVYVTVILVNIYLHSACTCSYLFLSLFAPLFERMSLSVVDLFVRIPHQCTRRLHEPLDL